MNKNRIIFCLSIIVIMLLWFSAGMGLFYSNGGQSRLVENIYGKTFQLFGDGVYTNNAMLKATTAKGSDLAMLLVSLGFLITTFKRDSGAKIKLFHGGFLAPILYYSATTAFGVTFSRMFLIYLLLFSAAFFTMVFTLIGFHKTIQPVNKDRKFIGTGIFTIIAGCTVLVWLMSILPTIFTNETLDIIEIYTTEPTFIIDIGIILPSCILGGVMLIRKKLIGYILPPIMLTFLTTIAVTVITQTALQMSYGVIISIGQVIGYAVTFVVFGIIAGIVNLRFLNKCGFKLN